MATILCLILNPPRKKSSVALIDAEIVSESVDSPSSCYCTTLIERVLDTDQIDGRHEH